MRTQLHSQQDSHDSYTGICDLLRTHMTRYIRFSPFSFYATNPSRNGWPLLQSIMTTGQITNSSCLACGYVSSSNLIHHPSITIGLPQGKKAERVLEILLDNHFDAERQPDYKCEHCGRKGHVERRTIIHSAPDILCLHLGRFIYDTSGRSKKDSSVVKINGLLDLRKHYINGIREKLDYELISSTLHSGGLGGGHYKCVARGPGGEDGRWALINDSSVTNATINDIIECHRYQPGFTPYLLFYRRYYP